MKSLDIINQSIHESSSVNSNLINDDIFKESLLIASNLLIETFKEKGKIMLAGNGGSAADCQHIAAEFMGRLNYDRDPLPAIALTANTSNLTCIANDYGYEYIFSRQMHALADKKDSLVVYSTSGNSENILKLVSEARDKVKSIIALTGSHTSKLEKYSDIVISVNSNKTTRIQEVHAVAGHILCECVEEHFFNK